MTTSVELKAGERDTLLPLFNDCRYDRVLIDSVLEGNFGFAHAAAASQPTVARLDAGAFTMLAGDTMAASVKGLLEHAPIYSRVSEILNRRRPLSLEMIRKLQAGVGLPADVLVQPYELQEPHRQAVATV